MDSPTREKIPTDWFWPLPRPDRADGAPRRTGIEIEFAGLSVLEAATVVHDLWGGEITRHGETDFLVRNGVHGEIKVKRDTTLNKRGAAGLLLDALGELVPVEIITPPLAPANLPEADRLVENLRARGARGTRDGVGFGFGVHLNPEVADTTTAAILPTVRAFGLLEDWLRASDPIDPARQMLPFVDAWPRRLLDRLADEAACWNVNDLTLAYLELSPTRNRGLDLLPLLEHLDPATVRDALPSGQAKGGRPTWHFRLPEARVDEPDWTIAYEWNRWCLVERVGARPALLAELAQGWQSHRQSLTTLRGDWARLVEALLWDAKIWQP